MPAAGRDVDVSSAAALFMLGEISCHRGAIEIAFACTFDAGRSLITAARVLARGNYQKVLFSYFDVSRGELVLHNHPSGTEAMPSDMDLESAGEAARYGVGFAVANSSLEQIVLIRAPGGKPPDIPYYRWVRGFTIGKLRIYAFWKRDS